LAAGKEPKAVIASLHAGCWKKRWLSPLEGTLRSGRRGTFYDDPGRITEFMKREIARWAPVIKKAGLVQ